MKGLTPPRLLETFIHLARGQKVMLDADLATLYGVETESGTHSGALVPTEQEEADALRSQIATSKDARGGRRYAPYVFTEHGVVMLSSVLNSHQAIQMSILVVNSFVRMRELIAANKDLAARVEKLERGHSNAASVIEVLVKDIEGLRHEMKLMKALPPVKKRRIGFHLA